MDTFPATLISTLDDMSDNNSHLKALCFILLQALLLLGFTPEEKQDVKGLLDEIGGDFMKVRSWNLHSPVNPAYRLYRPAV